ncbi:MAG: hypothetical protein AAF500_06810 [Myxococcota bacterium]
MLSQPTALTAAGKFVYDCNAACGGTLTDCEKKQACSKAKKLNNAIKKKRANNQALKIPSKQYPAARAAGDAGAASFRAACKATLKNAAHGEKGAKVDGMSSKFMHECAHKQWKKNKAADRDNFKGFQADHIHEIQLGGAPGPNTNLQFMTSRVNGSFGGRMKVIPSNATGVTSKNCC